MRVATKLMPVGSTRWLARAPPASGCLLAPEPFRNPDCRQLSRCDLLPSRNAPQSIERLRIEGNRESLRWRPAQADVNGFSRIEEPGPLLITELVPHSGLFAEGPSLSGS